MGSIYQKTVTRALPKGSEIVTINGKRYARWKDNRGKTKKARLSHDRDDRIVTTAATYTACFRDGAGKVREVATGCRDATAARKVLSDLEKRAENVKAGIHSASEDAAIDYRRTSLDKHFASYEGHQMAKGNDGVRIKNDKARFERLCRDCGWRQLSDLTGDSLSTWLANRTKDKMSAGNRNEFRQVMIGFANWCVRTNRLLANPFVNVPRADAKADQRRKRRALTEAELATLLDVAQRRPLEEALTIRRGKDKGKLAAKVRDEVREQLIRLGQERALIYKTLVLTGLRKHELASLTVGQLHLDGSHPYADLAPEDEKNREGSQIALRRDLAAELAAWIESRATVAEGCIPLAGRAVGLPASDPVFNVPDGLLRILNRDLKAAGIPKRDERGRTVDIHAMRHSFGTLLSKGGVAPRTAQAAMRHSTIDLTMNTYTDPKLLDVHGALDALPALSLQPSDAEAQRATGTTDQSLVAVNVAVNPHNSWQSLTSCVDSAIEAADTITLQGDAVSALADNDKQPLSSSDKGCHRVERKGVEPSTSALRTQRSPN